MADGSRPESGAGEAEAPKIKAEDNPWYLLATLYGSGQQEKNRIAWNRYFAARLDPQLKADLIANGRYEEEELTPFLPEQLAEIKRAFAEQSAASISNLPCPKHDWSIHFKNVRFDGRANFEGFIFPDCSFEGAIFDSGGPPVRFTNAVFCKYTSFEEAVFHRQANFNGARFCDTTSDKGQTYFSGAKFFYEAYFDNAAFAGMVYFNKTMFSNEALFRAATFYRADFTDATFLGKTYFNGATFHCVEFLGRAKFEKDVSFDDVTFKGEANFTNAIFAGQSTFVNAKMKYDTLFKVKDFKTTPPLFFGTELHEGTVWPGREAWPLPKGKDEAGDFVRAYERLKLEMDRLKKHEDELDFFALELQSRRVLLGRWSWGLPVWLYGLFSDYGRSYGRPLIALFYLALIGTLFFLPSDALTPSQSLGLSVANTLSVFGFRKDFFYPHIIEGLAAPMKIFSALQTILGAILLFLFGLGIRNKFRMK